MILSEQWPPGSRLIEVASILRRAAGPEFDQRLRRASTPRAGTYTDSHAAITELQPRGIITFNYDDAHENATRADPYEVLLPTRETQLRRALGAKLRRRFLLKAHGSVRSTGPLVLTYESYRNLIVRQPAYRAFLQTILTDFHLLIVGFGLADPDFDLFLTTMAGAFGSPLQEHVVINRSPNTTPREVELRRRFGIRTLYVREWSEIPALLRHAATSPGPRLRDLLQRCVVGNMEERGRGHDELRVLSPSGRRAAGEWLKHRLQKERNPHFLSEMAYSLGVLDARGYKDELIRVVDSAKHSAPAARALTVLRPALDATDLRRIRDWVRRFSNAPLRDDPGNRLAAYCRYLEVYVPAKFDSDMTHRRRRRASA